MDLDIESLRRRSERSVYYFKLTLYTVVILREFPDIVVDYTEKDFARSHPKLQIFRARTERGARKKNSQKKKAISSKMVSVYGTPIYVLFWFIGS